VTFANTIKKLRAEKLPVWRLFLINTRGTPQLVGKFSDEDLKRSIAYLEEQIKFFSDESQEVCFEIHAKQKLHSNGENAELAWEFSVPPASKKEEPSRFNGYGGLGMLDHPYVQRELGDLRAEKRALEEKREALMNEKLLLAIEKNDLKRDKELWAKELEQQQKTFQEEKARLEREYKEMEKKFDDNVETGKAAMSKFFHTVVRPMIDDLTEAKEPLGAAQPKSPRELIVESIASNLFASELSLEELKMIGIHVQKLKERFESASTVNGHHQYENKK